MKRNFYTKRNIDRIFKFLLILGFIFIAWFVWYGITTDCPNTAGYVYCPKELR